jgi:hypothetical protein
VFRGSGFVGGSDDGGRTASHFGFQKNEGLWGDGLPLVGEWFRPEMMEESGGGRRRR